MSEVRSELLVSGMKLRSEKNLDGKEGQKNEAEEANLKPTDPIGEREQTLSRRNCNHHEDLEWSADNFEPERIEESRIPRSVPRPIQERNLNSKGPLDRRRRTVVGERSNLL